MVGTKLMRLPAVRAARLHVRWSSMVKSWSMVVTDLARKWMTHDERTGFPFRLGLNAAGIPVSEEPGETMAFVTIRIKGTEGYSRTALDKERLVVGRASASDLPIKHTSISREHVALIRITSGTIEQWAVEDLGSSNGVWVNAEKLVPSGRRTLVEKDMIKAGKARLTFHAGSLSEAEAEAAIELDGGDEANVPTRTRGVDDPPESIPCQACNAWMSIAHRTAGDNMDCPRCGATNPVPELVTA